MLPLFFLLIIACELRFCQISIALVRRLRLRVNVPDDKAIYQESFGDLSTLAIYTDISSNDCRVSFDKYVRVVRLDSGIPDDKMQ